MWRLSYRFRNDSGIKISDATNQDILLLFDGYAVLAISISNGYSANWRVRPEFGTTVKDVTTSSTTPPGGVILKSKTGGNTACGPCFRQLLNPDVEWTPLANT